MAQVARGLALGVATGIGAAYGLMSHTANLSSQMENQMETLSQTLSWAKGEGVVSHEPRPSVHLSTVDEMGKLKDEFETGIDELADVASSTSSTVQADGRARWNTLIISLCGGDTTSDGPAMEPMPEVAKKFASNVMNTAIPSNAIKMIGYGADQVGTAASAGIGLLKDEGIVDIEAASTKMIDDLQGKLQEKLPAEIANAFSLTKKIDPAPDSLEVPPSSAAAPLSPEPQKRIK